MNRRRIADVVKGLASLVALLVLVGGPPWALVHFVGWPLPTTIPSFDEIDQAVRVGIDDTVVVKALAVVAWFAWAQVALSVVLEAAAATRGRSARRGALVPGLQALVGRLVASATLVVTTANTLYVPAVGAAPVAVASVVQMVPAAPADVGMTLDVRSVGPEPGTVLSSVVTSTATRHDDPHAIEVRRHDSWWAIAERTLGDGLRWQEIRQINLGRTMPDGHTITADTHQLQPGWLLRLPADATVTTADNEPSAAMAHAQAPAAEQQPPAQDTPAPVTGEATVVPGDSMWRIADRCLGDLLGRRPSTPETAIYWAAFVEANRDRFVDPANPDLIHAGQTFVLPALPPVLAPPTGGATTTGDTSTTPGPPPRQTEPPPAEAEPPTGSTVPHPPDAPTTPDGDQPTQPAPTTTTSTDADHSRPAPTTTTRPTDSTRPPDTTSDPMASRSDEPRTEDTDGSTSPAPLLVGAGVTSVALAVGVTRAIGRRRRRRNYHAPTTAPVAGGDEDLHRQLLLDADQDLTDALANALDGLAIQLANAGHRCRPRIVQHDAEHLDVLLDQATLPAAAGWRAQADGEVWSHDPTQPAATDTEPGQVMAAPLLVTLGEPDDGGQLYLDLETAQVVTLAGNLDVAHDLASTLITELAHSPFTDGAQIILVGDLGSPRHADLDRVTVVDHWNDVADNLTAWTEQSRQALTANNWPNSFVARGHDPDHPALVPLVVFAAEPPEDPDLLTLVQTGPTATAVVTIGEVMRDTAAVTINRALPGTTVIDCQPGLLSLPQLGLTCRPQVLSSDDVDAVAELLDIAEDTSGEELVFTLDHPRAPAGPDGTADTHELYYDPPHEILVRFLGDISVEGGQHPLTAKQTALVAYIALHGSVSTDRVVDAVWVTPSAVSPRKRLANLMTKCRGALGARHLPVVKDNHYAIGPDVATDVDLFERRVTAAARMAPKQAAKTLHGALDLVRGPVFDYPGTEHESYTWVALGNWISHWELQITKAARHAADLYLDLGDPGTAAEISDRMHRVVPTDPGLTEALMRAHHANGDRHAVRSVYQAHITALEQLDLDTVAESTLALYEQLRAS